MRRSEFWNGEVSRKVGYRKVEEYKKKVKEMEREKADQEQLHTSSEERIEELTAEVHR